LTNKYLYHLCQDDTFWREKTRRDFKEKEESIIAQEKYSSLTWRQWYFFWQQDWNRNLVFTLNFNPVEAYQQVVSEHSLILGTETFQTIDIALKKVILAHDKDLYDYFKKKFYSLAEKYYQDERSIPTRLINYAHVIPLALKEGYDDLAQELLVFMKDERNLFLHEDRHQLVNEMGRLGLVDIYYDKLLPMLYDNHQWKDLDNTFLSGLIEGFHNLEAKRIFQTAITNKYFTLGYGYVHYISIASKVDNVEFANFLDSLIPTAQKEKYLNRNSGILLAQDLRMKVIEEDGIKIWLREEDYDSTRSFDDYFITTLQNKTYSRMNIDYNVISEKRLGEIFKGIKDSPYNFADFISSCVNNGRYRFIHDLNFDDLTFFGYVFWQRVAGKITETSYKDLFLYLIVHLARYDIELYQRFLEQTIQSHHHTSTPLSYEMYLLIHELLTHVTESVDDLNFYSLLTSIYY
jgi:hypothetical protein